MLSAPHAQKKITHTEGQNLEKKKKEEEGKGLITLPLTLLPAPTIVLETLSVPAPPRAAPPVLLRATAPSELLRSPAVAVPSSRCADLDAEPCGLPPACR